MQDQDQSNEQALDPVFSIPDGALFIPNANIISALENAEALDIPEAKNWDMKETPKVRGFFLELRVELFPSLKRDAVPGEKEEVETVFFKAVVDGKPRDLYCAARQFVRKIRYIIDMLPEGSKFPFEAEYTGEGKGKTAALNYKKFEVFPLKMQQK